MPLPTIPESSYLMRMADGTIKQVNPFTGTGVWTVPGRGNRPSASVRRTRLPSIPPGRTLTVPFAPSVIWKLRRKKRGWSRRVTVSPPCGKFTPRRCSTAAEFRRIPNLFEIVSFDYWRKNFDYRLPDAIELHKNNYLASEVGRRHVLQVIDQRMKAAGMDDFARNRSVGGRTPAISQRLFRRRS